VKQLDAERIERSKERTALKTLIQTYEEAYVKPVCRDIKVRDL
jgi:hypothetical protein